MDENDFPLDEQVEVRTGAAPSPAEGQGSAETAPAAIDETPRSRDLADLGLPPGFPEDVARLSREIAELRAQLQTSGIGPTKPDEKGLLSAQEFADLTSFSVHSIRDWCERGQLPGMKIGNRWRLDREQAMMALKSMDRKKRRKRRAQDAA